MNTLQVNPPERTVLQIRGTLRPALAMAAIALIGFGLLYSLVAAAAGGLLFPQQARGSVIDVQGKPVGSILVAQPFADARYLQPRPSAAKYDPMAAAGSNQARTNAELLARIEETRQRVASRDGIVPAQVARDLVTQSGSGLDPDISPAAAAQQVARIAHARSLPEATVRQAIASATRAPQFGVLGPARVNVLQANLALDAVK